jgi:hypothetical protein
VEAHGRAPFGLYVCLDGSPGQSPKSDHLRAVPLAQEKRMPGKWSEVRKEEAGEYGMLGLERFHNSRALEFATLNWPLSRV